MLLMTVQLRRKQRNWVFPCPCAHISTTKNAWKSTYRATQKRRTARNAMYVILVLRSKVFPYTLRGRSAMPLDRLPVGSSLNYRGRLLRTRGSACIYDEAMRGEKIARGFLWHANTLCKLETVPFSNAHSFD